MAAVIGPKYSIAGSGQFQCDVDTDNVANPHTIKPIVRVIVNLDAYNQLAAAGKTDINNVTLNTIISQAFS